ncbi:MAG: tRNA-binding protein [Marinilabiliales bacterium]|nr:MAG: tRNA-binding protein [Marinilabiliales bacterium]
MIKDYISWTDFDKVEMRVGTIINAVEFEEAIKPAYKITVDFGKYGIKKTSAQITKLYKIEDLKGRQIIAVINFAPKQIANFMSEFLILGVMGDEKEVTLIQPTNKTSNGRRVQ